MFIIFNDNGKYIENIYKLNNDNPLDRFPFRLHKDKNVVVKITCRKF